jgi:uncharacterized protein (DUF2267 family)
VARWEGLTACGLLESGEVHFPLRARVNMPIDERALIERLQSLAPFGDSGLARRALDTTLLALRSGLTDDESDWLSLDLGPSLAVPLQRQSYGGDLSLNEFYRRMGRDAGLRRSVAIEQAQVVCRALAELLPEAGVRRLQKHMPELAPLFRVPAPPPPVLAPEHLHSEPSPDHTLAGGRPGSERPLSEGGTPSGHAFSEAPVEQGHSHSVARTLDPHADTRLSSARGLTQEREAESLARRRMGGS